MIILGGNELFLIYVDNGKFSVIKVVGFGVIYIEYDVYDEIFLIVGKVENGKESDYRIVLFVSQDFQKFLLFLKMVQKVSIGNYEDIKYNDFEFDVQCKCFEKFYDDVFGDDDYVEWEWGWFDLVEILIIRIVDFVIYVKEVEMILDNVISDVRVVLDMFCE